MAKAMPSCPIWSKRRVWCGASLLVAVAALLTGSFIDVRTTRAQQRQIVSFPARPKASPESGSTLIQRPGRGATPHDQKEPMLVRADEINYDYANERVAAVGNVQIYRNGSTLEADRVIYDQKTKRLHAEGKVRLQEPDGKITYGDIIDLSDDYRDGFVDSLRLEGPDQTTMAANRADRTEGNFTVMQSGVYTACEPCKDDPKKPPKWQVKAARMIHAQGEQMIYFEDMSLEFFGIPLAWMPFFSVPDPTAKRKSGFLIPSYSSSSVYGFGLFTPYYLALSDHYDVTISPLITSKEGPLALVEWRQRLMNGSYFIRGSGIFQLDKEAFVNTPGYQDFRGHINTEGKFSLSDKWTWGWEGWLISDKTYLQDYSLYKGRQNANLLMSTPDYALSQGYLQGRGDRSFFDIRAQYFYGFTTNDDQKLSPIIHPVLDHDYTVGKPVLGGELSFHTNLTSLNRDTAAFDPINQNASNLNLCGLTSPDPSAKTPANCILRGMPGDYTRVSTEASWRRTFVDPFGQVFTPFASVRGDFADLDVTKQDGVGNFLPTGHSDVARFMPTAGLEYRYPFINVQSWGTQTIEPIAQIIVRPNETDVGKLPNEDAQSLVFDASNLFNVNKFSGWDRVEGGGRANAGLQYTAQFNRGGYFNALFGQSYQLFGQNSFALGGTTNTGAGSGLDTDLSDYVARMTFQPSAQISFTSRFRFAQTDFSLQRTEFETNVNFDRWTLGISYGNYAAQPQLGFLDRREGVVASARYKLSPNWQLLGAIRYDLMNDQIQATQVGAGYIDDCIILALSYSTEFSYSATTTYNSTVMFQLSLRTLGGTSFSTGASTLDSGLGLPK